MLKQIPEGIPRFATWSDNLVKKFSRKPYRDAYVSNHVKRWIAMQIRALREERNWSQKKLSEDIGTRQSNVSRIEDPDYGQLSLQTLFDLAAAYDVALIVKFVNHRTFLAQSRYVGPGAMSVDSFSAAAIAPQQYPETPTKSGPTFTLSVMTATPLSVDADLLSLADQNASAFNSGFMQ